MVYLMVLCIVFLACCAVLAVSRIVERSVWRRRDRLHASASAYGPRSIAFDDVRGRQTYEITASYRHHQAQAASRSFAVRLPLWVATLGIAVCVTTIGVAIGVQNDDGELTLTHMVALTIVFAAGAVMTLMPSAGFYDIEVNPGEPGHLTFRRLFVIRRRIRIDQVRFCLITGGVMALSIPGRKRPLVADQTMHGYGRLLGQIATNDVPIIWKTLPANADHAA